MFGPDSVRGSGSASGGGGAGNPFGFGDLGDVFDVFFGGGGARGQSRPGVRRGAETRRRWSSPSPRRPSVRTVGFVSRWQQLAPRAKEAGRCPGTSPTSCPECRGSGQIQRVRQSFLGQMVTASPCHRCDGTGEVIASPCSDCRGQGRRNEDRSMTVTVPAGVDTGSTLRVQGGGQAALRGGVPGDLYVHLRVAEDARSARDGDDLVTYLRVLFAQAALGTSVDIDTLESPEARGRRPRYPVRNRCAPERARIPRLRGRGRGDLLVQVVVETPTKLAKDEEALLRELAALRGEEVAEADHGMLSRLRSKLT